MNLRNLAEFPQPGIRLEHRLLDPIKKAVHHRLITVLLFKRQTIVNIKWEQAYQYLSVHIVLHLHIGLVSYAYRLVAQIALEWQVYLFEIGRSGDGIERLHPSRLPQQNTLDIIEVALELIEVPQFITCLARIVGVAKPAIAIIPRTFTAIVLRKTRRSRGNNTPGIFVL